LNDFDEGEDPSFFDLKKF
jgi:hypothetical protein